MQYFLKEHIGELVSLLTALLWTITAMSFESASLKVGSLPVNIIRLVFGFLFLSLFTLFYRGYILPFDASSGNWIWLSISGLIGFVFGDLFLFRSFTLIGSRFSMLIMTLVPPLTALLGWMILKEKLTLLNYTGMALTITGISMAIFSRDNDQKRKLKLKLIPKGILFAFFGALGQAIGLVISKYGMKDYDPFASTQIRIIAGILGFVILITISAGSNDVFKAFKNKRAMFFILIGAFFGLFLGVSFSQLAIQKTETGIASTLMSLVPVFIIFPTIIIYKQNIQD